MDGHSDPTAWSGKDFYAVLEVDRESSPIEVRRAYRAAAKHLGDTGVDDPRRVELEEAYTVLRDATLRAEYDGLPLSRVAVEEAPAAGAVSPMRRWGAIGVATAIAASGYTAFIAALISDDAAATQLGEPVLEGLAVQFAIVGIAVDIDEIERLVAEQRWAMYALFIGMTLGGGPELLREARGG